MNRKSEIEDLPRGAVISWPVVIDLFCFECVDHDLDRSSSRLTTIMDSLKIRPNLIFRVSLDLNVACGAGIVFIRCH